MHIGLGETAPTNPNLPACGWLSRPYDNTGGVITDANGVSTPGGKGCTSIFALYPVEFAVAGAALIGLFLFTRRT